MSKDDSTSPPQYIVTTPSEAEGDDEDHSLHDFEGTINAVTESMVQQEQHQKRVVSQMSRQIASRSFSVAAAGSVIQEESKNVTEQLLQHHQQQQQQQQKSQQVYALQKTISANTRSQSLQSGNDQTLLMSNNTLGSSTTTTKLSQQLKAKSSTSIVSSEQRTGSFMQKTSSTTSSAATKSKFQSFLQQPDAVMGHPTSTSSGHFLTAHQKHVRQFVRSTSAHSETNTSNTTGTTGRPEKCIRSASAQIDDSNNSGDIITGSETLTSSTSNKLSLQQSSSILISKSAETIETKSLATASTSTSARTHLTLSGGFLAPPNRKITILSPIHAPPGLHDMIKRAGRSPLSPRISFPGSEADIFG
uniref:Uncharacterized protein n=1 Tax=Glossina austeni TaxID=7395 RepID=A0A1A9UU43_GLOAU